MAKRRLKPHKRIGMTRRMKSWKKPMTLEQKEARKKKADEQRANQEKLNKVKKTPITKSRE